MQTEPEQLSISYLLDELDDGERTAFEESYFADKAIFESLIATESDLIDDYVGGRLSAEAHQRFETVYMANPEKRERVAFAKALAARVAQEQVVTESAPLPTWNISLRDRFAALFAGQRLRQFAGAFAILLAVFGGVWLFTRNGPNQQNSSARVQPTPESPFPITGSEKTPPLADETPPLTSNNGSGSNHPSPKPTTTPNLPPASRTAVLALTIGGLRGSNPANTPTLSIQSGTRDVSIRLRIREDLYPNYRYSIKTASGGDIIAPTNIKASRAGSGAAFTIRVPAGSLPDGDYILTLSGTSTDGSSDAIGRSLFRTKKN